MQPEQSPSIWQKGNVSARTAAISNSILAIIKGAASLLSGSAAMLAEAVHTLADAANQWFVYLGSVWAEKPPTEKYPHGFGRLINVFCMVAVLIITLMAWETIRHGWHLLHQPEKPEGIWWAIAALLISLLFDGAVWVKAAKEVVREARVEASGLTVFLKAFSHVKLASPPTRLVFYEDLIATSGAVLALIAIALAYATNQFWWDGLAAILIGLMLLGIAFKVGYENMQGLIGVAPHDNIQNGIAETILACPQVVDIQELRVVMEGRFLYVTGRIELTKGLTLASAEDIKEEVKIHVIEAYPDVRSITLGIVEDNGVLNWEKEGAL